MNNIIPFFELNGQRYEITATHYLLAEYEKLTREVVLSDEDKANSIRANTIIQDVEKYAKKVKELEEKFFDTFDSEDERRYLKAKELYENAISKFTKLEVETGSTTKLQKASIDVLEKIAIKGIAEKYFNLDEVKAKNIWEQYSEKIGNNATIEWLTAMSECLFNKTADEDEIPFLVKMREAKEKLVINRKNGIKKN